MNILESAPRINFLERIVLVLFQYSSNVVVVTFDQKIVITSLQRLFLSGKKSLLSLVKYDITRWP